MAWELPENDDLIDRVVLVLSELVTNAVVHGRTRPPGEKETVGVVLAFKKDFALGLLVGLLVTDNSNKVPIPKIRPSADDVRGRGLTLVTAESDGWTTTPYQDREGCKRKGVWAFFQCPRSGVLPGPLPHPA